MEQNTAKEAEGYLELLEGIKQRVEDEGTAVRILSEVAKDRRMEIIRQERHRNGGSSEVAATDAQKRYMKKLGIEVEEGLTKAGASELLDQQLEKKGPGAVPSSPSATARQGMTKRNPYVTTVEASKRNEEGRRSVSLMP